MKMHAAKQALRAAQKERAAPSAAYTVTPSLLNEDFLQRKACACGGQCPRCSEGKGALTVSTPGDRFEREADRAADQVMRMPASTPRGRQSIDTSRHLPVQGQAGVTEDAEEPETALQTKATDRANTVPAARTGAPIVRGAGESLSQRERDFFEPRFGINFSNVRIHNNDHAANLANEFSARAFTLGRDVVFARGEYQPATFPGRQLLAHELTHVVQQSAGRAKSPNGIGISRKDGSSIMRVITHSGTPTNCHNWTLPLPPWIAGSLAHRQLQAYFAARPGTAGLLVPEMPIPRGTKAAGLMVGVPNPPYLTPAGFADLWALGTAGVQIGEIKSTYQGGAVATREAAHYVLRHTEWLTRMPATFPDDLLYELVQGGLRLPGNPMSGLAAVTGTGVSVGPFIGDPLKTLWAEADTAGAVCYWCTGTGIFNPVWVLVFVPLIQRAIDEFRAAIRAAGEALAWIGDRINDVVEWGREHPVLAFIILLAIVIIGYILAIIFGFLEAPTFGLDTPLTIGSAATATGALMGLLVLLGIDTGDVEPAINETAAFVYPQAQSSGNLGVDYERDTHDGNWRNATAPVSGAPPTARLVAALTPIREQVMGKIADIANPLSGSPSIAVTPSGIAQVKDAARFLARSTDPELQQLGSRVQQISNGVWA